MRVLLGKAAGGEKAPVKPCGQGAGRSRRCLLFKKTWKGKREGFPPPFFFSSLPWLSLSFLRFLSSYKTPLVPTGPFPRIPSAKLRSKEKFSERWPRSSVEKHLFPLCGRCRSRLSPKCWRKLFAAVLLGSFGKDDCPDRDSAAPPFFYHFSCWEESHPLSHPKRKLVSPSGESGKCPQ